MSFMSSNGRVDFLKHSFKIYQITFPMAAWGIQKCKGSLQCFLHNSLQQILATLK